jgi:hypothetical protein
MNDHAGSVGHSKGGRAGYALAGVVARAADRAEYARWAEQVAGAGYCRQPVRLSGEVEHADTSSGELRGYYSTDIEPDGVILKACGTRRASRCEPCSRTYRYDAYQLIGAGLRGGKGVPETMSGHPFVFATFTAPSFGRVHVRREQAGTVFPCHAGRLGERCQHGRRLGCWHRHDEDDPTLGLPVCPDCYDYQAAVIWNAMAPELWRRTTISIARVLARLAGVPRSELAKVVRISYVKVAEFQRRGQVHYHAIIRLDGLDQAGEAVTPDGFTIDLLIEAIRAAAGNVRAPIPAAPEGRTGPDAVGWGQQLDIRVISRTETAGELSAERVARYVAKYATKAAETVGPALDRPIKSARDLARLDLPDHAARLVRICWTLGGRPEFAGLGLRRWAHMLGYRGHFLTRSRRYSTTFRELRGARRAWSNVRRYGPEVRLDRDGRRLPPDGIEAVSSLVYEGLGYTTAGDAWLAWSMEHDAREQRGAARDAVAGRT